MSRTTGGSIGDKMVGGMTSFSSSATSNNRDEGIANQHHEPSAAQYGLDSASNPNPNPNMLQRYADHTYHDFSTYIEDGGEIKKHKKSERNFPARLHTILSDAQYAHIISWMPHGRAWKVLNKSLFVDEVIPKFFGQSKFASFTRQLSGWGFKRLHQTGADFGCYYHECFLRGHPKLTVLMRRVSVGKGKATPNMHAEPDFYVIAKEYPLDISPNVAGKTAAVRAPTNNRQWDSHDQSDKRKPHHAAHAAAAYQKKEVDSPNQHNKSKPVGQHHSFSSSDETRAELERRRVESHAQDEMSYYDYYAMSNPRSLDLNQFSSMQTRQEEIMNQHYASNVYQQTPGSLHHGAAAAHYFTHPQYYQQQQVHDYYGYTNPYYSNFYNDGQLPGSSHGQASHQAASRMGYPGQEYNQFFPPNSFTSTYNSYFEDK